jgi:hypothetical protein
VKIEFTVVKIEFTPAIFFKFRYFLAGGGGQIGQKKPAAGTAGLFANLRNDEG